MEMKRDELREGELVRTKVGQVIRERVSSEHPSHGQEPTFSFSRRSVRHLPVAHLCSDWWSFVGSELFRYVEHEHHPLLVIYFIFISLHYIDTWHTRNIYI